MLKYFDPHIHMVSRTTDDYQNMAAAGITCVGEFHYLHHQPGGMPYDDPNEMGRALVEAARQAGIRLTLLDAVRCQTSHDRGCSSGSVSTCGVGSRRSR